MARFLEQLRYIPIKKGAIFILPEAANKQKKPHQLNRKCKQSDEPEE